MSGYDRALLAAAIRRGHTDRVAGQIAAAIDTALEHERQYAHLDSRITEAISLLDAAWQVVQAYRADLDRTTPPAVASPVGLSAAANTDRPPVTVTAPPDVDQAYASWMHLVDCGAPSHEIAVAHATYVAATCRAMHPSNRAAG
jgi:hypothetical protein